MASSFNSLPIDPFPCSRLANIPFTLVIVASSLFTVAPKLAFSKEVVIEFKLPDVFSKLDKVVFNFDLFADKISFVFLEI